MMEGNGEVRELPRGWCCVTLEDIAEILPGCGFPKEIQGKIKGKYPFFKVGDISKNIKLGNKYLILCDHYIDDQELKKIKGRLLPKDSIVFAKIGEALKLNRRAILKVSSLVDNNVVGVKGFEIAVNYLYLFYYLKTIHLEDYSRATTVPSVRKSDIERIKLPLSPLAEQERIVEKIEELFSDLDQGIENLKKAQKQLKVYRQVVLKWAFEGKLTEKWRSQIQQEKLDIQTGEELLAQIKAERETRYQQQLAEYEEAVREWEAIGKVGKKPAKPSKLKDVLPLTETELAEFPQLPDDWRWVKLGSISTSIQIGPFGSLLHKSDYVLNQIPAINPSHIKNLRIIPDFNQTITSEKASALANYVLTKGAIIMGRRGEMGRCAVVTEKEDKYLCGTGSLFIRLIDQLNNFFYCFILSSRRVKTHLENSSIGTTMQNLNEDILHDVPVPLCSPVEQDKILEEIELRLSICDRLEDTIIENLQKAEALRQSILKQAFEGKLVPQDPNDEPAEKLLERIKQEKSNRQKGEQLSIQGL